MQTFKDYTLTLVDDCSTDGTRKIMSEIKEADIITLGEKRFNGGSRNVGVAESPDGEYLLFLDADDEFVDPQFFEKLHKFIEEKNRPDMIRLRYIRVYDHSAKNHQTEIYYDEKTLEDVTWSPRVAPWTKCIRKSLFQKFPENTLMEDVCQHLCQLDVTDTVEWFPDVVVKWHLHDASTSHNNSPKWQSSAWRFVADLMDLDLKRDYTKWRRDKKVKGAIRGLMNGEIKQ